MLALFISLYLISTLIMMGIWIYAFTQIDAWSLKNWFEIDVTEDEFDKIKKIGTIILLTPLSILFLFLMFYQTLKDKGNL